MKKRHPEIADVPVTLNKSAMQDRRYVLVEDAGQYGYNRTLKQVERYNAQADKAEHVLHRREDGCTHGDDRIHRHAVECAVHRQKNKVIDQRTGQSHA